MATKFDQYFKDQLAILSSKKIINEENRKGLRQSTGELLEAAFIDLATRLNPALSVEVGAHEAAYSQCIKRALPDTRVLAFEANPFVYRHFVDSFSEEIEYSNLAISNADCEVNLHIPVSLNGNKIDRLNPISSVLTRNHEGFKYRTVQVPAQTLDTISRLLEVDGAVAWIDVEGAQEQVISGGECFFSRAVAIYMELERKEVWKDQNVATELIEVLAGFGLSLLMMDNLASGQYNAVFVRMSDDIAPHAQTVVLNYLNELDLLF